MPDNRFFQRSGSLSVQELAHISQSKLGENSNPDHVIDDVQALDTAGSSDLSFLDNIKYKDQFLKTKAGACFIVPDLAPLAPKGLNLLFTSNPYKSYALAAQVLYPEEKPVADISSAAGIHDSAKIGTNCVIESGVIINENVEIGDECWIGAGSVIGQNVSLGHNCRIGSNVTISHSIIGDNVRLYPGVCIGQDGFGFALDPAGHVKVPQLGRVIIEDHVEIGANSCIDRGAGPDTVIGQGTWIDNLVQIGHNVKIGRGCVIVAQVGISGSVVVEDYVAIGGQVGIAGHLHIGKNARIGAQSGVIRDIPAGSEYLGSPALPIKEFMRQVVTLKRMVRSKKDH